MGLFDSKSSGIKLLFKAINNKDYENVKAILSSDNKKGEVLKLHEKNKEGDYPFLSAVKSNNFEIVYLIIEYANKNKILLKIEEQNKEKEYPLLIAAKNNNMRIVYLLFDYAKVNNIILNIEIKDARNNYPLYFAAKNNNTEMFKFFMDYANNNDIVMDINDQTILNDNPLFRSIFNYNSEITSIILDYSKKYKMKTNISCSFRNDTYRDSILLGIIDEISQNKKDKQRQKEKQKQIELLNQNGYILKKGDENYSEAVVLYDFESSNSKEISVNKGEYIVVTDWNIADGWVLGYKKDNPQEYGKIPRLVVNRCIEDDIEGDLVSVLYNFKGNTSDELEIKKDEYLRILDWNVKDGWVYGYVEGNRQKKGLIPKLFIRKIYYENQDHLPSYEEVMMEQNKEE